MTIRPIKILIISLLFAGITILFTQSDLFTEIHNVKLERELLKNLASKNLVAHACGEYNGITFTNSLNSLNSNYKKGYRFFEVDFHLSSDSQIVLIHDWNLTAERLFGTSGIVYSRKEFTETKTKNNLVLLDIDSLISWLKTHNDAFIITDCKEDSLGILKNISIKYSNMMQRFYIQMYFFSEYPVLQEMGYKNIILALYRTKYNDSDVIKFVRNKDIYAVSMEVKRAETNLPIKLKQLNLKVYAHCVNSLMKYKNLLNNGIYGIYTDSIIPVSN